MRAPLQRLQQSVERLQQSGMAFPHFVDSSKEELVSLNETITAIIRHQHSSAQRTQWLKEEGLFAFEYKIYTTFLAESLSRVKKEDIEDNNFLYLALLEQTKTALIMAEFLQVLYRDYLCMPREVKRLEREKTLFYAILSHDVLECEIKLMRRPVGQTIRQWTSRLNWPRLLLARMRRFFIFTAAFTKDVSPYRRCIVTIDNKTANYFAYLAWLFFAPRLIYNLAMLIKHTLPFFITKEARSLGWKTRFTIQWQRRWGELANDSAWFMVGGLNCLLLIGTLAPMGVYALIALQAFDVIVSSLRMHTELKQFRRLQQAYLRLQVDDAVENDFQRYKDLIDQHIRLEYKRLRLSVINTVVLVVAMALTAPIFICLPVLPAIGAAIAVITMATMFVLTTRLERKRASLPLNQDHMRALGFFNSHKEKDVMATATVTDTQGATGETPLRDMPRKRGGSTHVIDGMREEDVLVPATDFF